MEYPSKWKSFNDCLDEFSLSKFKDWKSDSFILSGVIAKFNLTFDLSWKLMKEIITDYFNIDGYAIGSPSENIKKAFECGIIEDDNTWIKIMKLRNLLIHDYNGDIAKEECETIVNKYVDFFISFREDIYEFLKQNYK